MLQKVLIGLVAAVTSFAVHAYGEGGNDSGASEAFLATKSVAPAALKAARANLFAGAVNTILANNAASQKTFGYDRRCSSNGVFVLFDSFEPFFLYNQCFHDYILYDYIIQLPQNYVLRVLTLR